MKSKPLTQKQTQFFELLLNHKREHGIPPSIRELQEKGGYASPRSVLLYLEALEDAGYIKRSAGARQIQILKIPNGGSTDQTATVQVPVIGRVAAGLPILAEENWVDEYPVSTRLARPPQKYFILKVIGDSMNRAGINDGDFALVRQQSYASPGDKVVALINGEATIKFLRPRGEIVALEPASSNPEHKPILVDRDFRIQGIVVAAFPYASEELSG